MTRNLIIGALALSLFVIPEFTRSQAVTRPGYDGITAAELGARLCVNEGSWRALDCAAILHIRRRSVRAGEDFKHMLIRLHGDLSLDRNGQPRELASLRSHRALSVHPRDGRPWIGDLRADGHEPMHWGSESIRRGNEPAPWDGAYRSHWLDTVELAQGVIDGTVADPCRGRSAVPNTWGNRRSDHARAIRRGYEFVDCGATANEYWRQ